MKKIDFKKELNDEQYNVVSSGDGAKLVLAGAGSGKTRTLVYRVAWLINNGVRPEEILLLTFTNKAANEMLERVNCLIFNERIKKIHVWGGTFHATANRLLKIYGTEIGIQKDFTIMDSDDSKSLINHILKDNFLTFPKKQKSSSGLIQEVFSFSINSGIEINETLEVKFPQWQEFLIEFENVEIEYKKRKKESKFLDFDDLLYYFKELVTNKKIGRELKNKWEHVLIDEYQDTNYLQAEIIKELCLEKNNVLAVGDDAQSIYSFRAADIKNIIEFPKIFKNCKIYKLEKNYRSTPEILNLANRVISENQNQFSKNLKAILSPYVKPYLIALNDNREEAWFIVDKIKDFLQDEKKPNDIAVLFRAGSNAQTLEMELNKAGISYEMRGGLRFFERSHIKDVIAFLKIINHINDYVSLFRVLNFYEGIGEVTVKNIYDQIKKFKNTSELIESDIKIPNKAYEGWKHFIMFLKKIEKFKNENPGKLISTIIEEYYFYLSLKYEDFKERHEDLVQLSYFASSFDNLKYFLDETALQESFNLKKNVNKNECIILSTIHQAKGLEWEIVFLINLTSDSLPHPLCVTKYGIEEERRLFYVAITRAKKYLYMTYPLYLFKYGELKNTEISEFIKGIDEKFLNFNQGSYSNTILSSGDITYEADDEIYFKNKSYLPEIDEL
ncbi:MAG: ATP-dependent helicase [Patescibacteria group bacterium]|nr:ATP-dependent helicase [Patescibacteria group bacterium]